MTAAAKLVAMIWHPYICLTNRADVTPNDWANPKSKNVRNPSKLKENGPKVVLRDGAAVRAQLEFL
jgi:hypothetical protein